MVEYAHTAHHTPPQHWIERVNSLSSSTPRTPRARRWSRRVAAIVVAAALLSLGLTVGTTAPSAQASDGGFSPQVKPRALVDPDRVSVELGVKFSVKTAGQVVGMEFYRTPRNRGPHVGTLWDAAGKKLASVRFTGGGGSGWASARFTTPVSVKPGKTYVVSYLAPHGGYSADVDYFNRPLTAGNISFPRDAGVYKYGRGGFPTSTYRHSNYYVDVQFQPAGTTPLVVVTPTPTPTRTASPSPAPTPRPTSSPTPTPTPTVTPRPTPSSPASGSLDLPRETWFGGPAYYARFPKAAASGWTSSSFFPISVFLGKPAHAQALKAAGVNTYMGVEHDGSSISEVTGKGVSVLPQRDEWTPAEIGNDPRAVGWLVSDECEMGLGGCTAGDEAGRLAQQTAWAKELRARGDGRFLQANFGNGVLGTHWAPTTMDDHLALVDVSSVDKYAYTSPHVQGLLRATPSWPAAKNPSSAGAYGWLEDRMETFSAGQKPNWVFVETSMPFLTEAGSTSIQTGQIEGAVWNALIHGASGIAYFQHNNNGSCGVYSILECGAERRDAIAAINRGVAQLAPVLNSQPYTWNFGPGLETSLRASGGSAYILAMTDGGTGSRTFALPPDLAHVASVTVRGENREIPVTAGTFTDRFDHEFTHHIYTIAID